MTPDGQAELDVSLEDELEAGSPAPADPTESTQGGPPAAAAKPRRRRPAKPPAPVSGEDDLARQAELRADLAGTRIGTAGITADHMAYARSPGMELNSTAARAIAGTGGRADLLVVAVEPGQLRAVTELVHRALGLLEPDPAD